MVTRRPMRRILNMEEDGLLVLFKPYQAELLRLAISKGEDGVNNLDGWEHLKTHDYPGQTKPEMSKASVIYTLEDLKDVYGLLTSEERTGRGGKRPHYFIAKPVDQLWKEVAKLVQKKLVKASGLPASELFEV